MGIRLAVAAALTVLGGSSPTGAGLANLHPCLDAIGYTCSTLDVPLDHGGRARGTMHLAVAVSDNKNASKGVLLVLTGGPGQPGVPLLGRVPRIVGAELRDYRVVMYDQRGTGAG